MKIEDLFELSRLLGIYQGEIAKENFKKRYGTKGKYNHVRIIKKDIEKKIYDKMTTEYTWTDD